MKIENNNNRNNGGVAQKRSNSLEGFLLIEIIHFGRCCAETSQHLLTFRGKIL